MNRPSREFDIVVWGATGFTGRLVCEYLARTQGVNGPLKWAVAARNPGKLSATCGEIATELVDCPVQSLPMLVADSDDPDSLLALVRRARVIVSTVGPYAWYGSRLVEACAENGTDYCDLSGELQWIREMIRTFDEPARHSGARLVHCCGFDSVPFDMGVWFAQREMQRRHGVFSHDVRGVVRSIKGSFSGGTYASMLNFVREAAADPALRRIAADPDALLPESALARRAPVRREAVNFDPDLGVWTGPWVMALVNTRIVRRSNALAGYPWGRDFDYEETMSTGRGSSGYVRARALQLGLGTFMASMTLAPARFLLERLLPAPGEGPDRQAREAGGYEIDFVARHPQDASRDVLARVRGDMDPGYGSTAKMLAECALCLAVDRLPTPGGSWTPAAALGETLLTRLVERAGVSFEVRSLADR
jgi:short subunit dehydrogenase-like uncharacterized protein